MAPFEDDKEQLLAVVEQALQDEALAADDRENLRELQRVLLDPATKEHPLLRAYLRGVKSLLKKKKN